MLTNGGGLPESEKAEEVNRKVGLPMVSLDPENTNDNLKLLGEHMILCHTPLSDPVILEEFRDKFVLVSGFYDELRVAQHYGYKYAVHVEELAAVYPEAVYNDLQV